MVERLLHFGSIPGTPERFPVPVNLVVNHQGFAMKDALLDRLLTDLEAFGVANDQTHQDRPRRMLNITRDTGELLAVLVRALVARRVLEIGTSNGYSTLWLASAARAIGGQVTTVELSDYKAELAAANFLRAGLAPCVEQVLDNAGSLLARQPPASVDLLFLD